MSWFHTQASYPNITLSIKLGHPNITEKNVKNTQTVQHIETAS